MLSCREAAFLMSQELDRRLSWPERLSLRFHVLICSACAGYRQQMAFLRKACGMFGYRDEDADRG